LERIIGKALEKDRELRYQHAGDIRSDLKRLKRESGVGQTTAASAALVGASKIRSRKFWRLAIPAGGLAAVLTAGFFLHSRRAPPLTEKDSIVVADFVNTTGDPSSTTRSSKVSPCSFPSHLDVAAAIERVL
jgi:hypothetical protein